jgi:hypothetical protein
VETLSDNQTEEEQVAMDSIPNVEVWEKYACDLTIVLSHLLSTAVCPILHNNQSILYVSLVENRRQMHLCYYKLANPV